MNNERIEMVRQYRILGVMFDESANWKALKSNQETKQSHLRSKNAPKNTSDDHTANCHTIWRSSVRISNKGDTQTVRSGTP
jgi:uncharacterized lipoprotein YddW (UPF0748 family)